MDRLHELERMRRSIAMLQPGSRALDREEAMRLIAELQDLERRMKALRQALAGVMHEKGSGQPG
jgi:vacuolar-type H+-ATPase subunit D/Vma8